MDVYKCNVIDCEFNTHEFCCYCGDIWELNSKDCEAFEEKKEM